MHAACRDFFVGLKRRYPYHFTGGDVLDVGSLDINGNLRDLFTQAKYVGLDIAEGKNVDIVGEFPRCMDFTKKYDTIVSAEMLEHDHNWNNSLIAMIELLRPGGLLAVTAAGYGRPEHGTPKSDGEHWASVEGYYRNITVLDLAEFFREETFSEFSIQYDGMNRDIRAWGIKRL